MNLEQISAGAWGKIVIARLSMLKNNQSGIAIIKTAIENATDQIRAVLEAERKHNESTISELENRLAATQSELDGADKVIAHYESRQIMEAASIGAPTEDTKLLGELLAMIHGDGGHYQSDHGTKKAVEDAVKKVWDLRIALDEAQQDTKRHAAISQTKEGNLIYWTAVCWKKDDDKDDKP